MLWKKSSNLRYVDLCIYIDKHVPDIIKPGECPALENTIYNYLWLLVKALAIKKRMFQNFQDYDGYAFYAANRLFFALRKNLWNQGKTIKGKPIRPIKSCLNYTKALLNPMKIEYQQEAYKEIIDEEFISKKFDAFTLKETLKINALQTQNCTQEFKTVMSSTFKNIEPILDETLSKLPFSHDSIEYKHIRMSILLSCLSSLKLKNKLNLAPQTPILWKLPKSMSEYLTVLIKEFYAKLKVIIMEEYNDSVIDGPTLEKIVSYKEGADYNYEN